MVDEVPEPTPEQTDPDPAPEQTVPDPAPEQTSSDLYKIVRAVNGDTTFRLRVEMALEIADKPNVRQNLVHIAKSVVDYIDCTVEGTVSTDRVTDQLIESAISTVPVQSY